MTTKSESKLNYWKKKSKREKVTRARNAALARHAKMTPTERKAMIAKLVAGQKAKKARLKLSTD